MIKFIKTKVDGFWNKYLFSITLSLLIFCFVIAVFWNRIFISIDPGYQGIRWSRFEGTQVDEIYNEGLHIIWPWDRMYLYTTRVQTNNNSLDILTTEGLTIKVEYTYRFHVFPDSIPVVHQELGYQYATTFVEPEIQAASMAVIGNYTPDQLYQISTLVVQSTIKHYLSKRLLSQNIVFDDYLIRKIVLPEVVSKSIEKKMVAKQLAMEFEYKLQVEAKEMERKKIEAEGISQFAQISGIPILKWKGLEVTEKFAESKNSKIIMVGNNENSLPLILNSDEKD
ncbi:MAG TPA: prohibitin family protein [Chitinispirillaceae bacterium]|nr:prohibitin family protein [Chitinispirillaceae bacterium]